MTYHLLPVLGYYDLSVTALAAPLYIVTGVLILAGCAKVLTPSPTATALRELKIPRPLLAARAMGVGEIVVGIAAIGTGHAILWAVVAVMYAGFAIFILWALNGNGAIGSCGCFGHEDTPPTPGHAAFNAAAATIAGLSAVDPVSLSDYDGSAFEAAIALLLVVAGVVLSIAALTSLPRILSLARGTAAPYVPTFSLENSTNSPQGNS